MLGDKHGSVVFFPERECSIQRRNQKVGAPAWPPRADGMRLPPLAASREGRDPMLVQTLYPAPLLLRVCMSGD